MEEATGATEKPKAQGWDYLPHDITYMIFKDLSFLDGLRSKKDWQAVVNILLVSSTFTFQNNMWLPELCFLGQSDSSIPS